MFAAVRRRGWVLGPMLGAFGFALILYAGFVFDGSSECAPRTDGAALPVQCARPAQLVNAGATLLFLGGGQFGLWAVEVVVRKTRGGAAEKKSK